MSDERLDTKGLTVAVIGAGVIGCSWAALFGAAGCRVRLYDSFRDAAPAMKAFWDEVGPTLIELGLARTTAPDIQIAGSLREAVSKTDLIQECIPERLDAKLALYREVETLLEPHTIVATSSSGFKLSELQEGWQNPGPIIIAHPFNPPHIIPLVELYGNARTAPGLLERAEQIYRSCGKTTITLRKEVIGHVANRLQAALWREAIHLVADGVASLKDIDTAITAGPGLRWAVMGPHLLLNLGGGEGGMRSYCDQFRDSYHAWWKDLGTPQLSDEVIERLIIGLTEEIAGRNQAQLRSERDRKLVAILRALKDSP